MRHHPRARGLMIPVGIFFVTAGGGGSQTANDALSTAWANASKSEKDWDEGVPCFVAEAVTLTASCWDLCELASRCDEFELSLFGGKAGSFRPAQLSSARCQATCEQSFETERCGPELLDVLTCVKAVDACLAFTDAQLKEHCLGQYSAYQACSDKYYSCQNTDGINPNPDVVTPG